MISDGFQSDMLIYFDIRAMDACLCLEDLQVGDIVAYFPELFEYLPSDKFRCASWVSELAKNIFRVLPFSSTFAGECVDRMVTLEARGPPIGRIAEAARV